MPPDEAEFALMSHAALKEILQLASLHVAEERIDPLALELAREMIFINFYIRALRAGTHREVCDAARSVSGKAFALSMLLRESGIRCALEQQYDLSHGFQHDVLDVPGSDVVPTAHIAKVRNVSQAAQSFVRDAASMLSTLAELAAAVEENAAAALSTRETGDRRLISKLGRIAIARMLALLFEREFGDKPTKTVSGKWCRFLALFISGCEGKEFSDESAHRLWLEAAPIDTTSAGKKPRCRT